MLETVTRAEGIVYDCPHVEVKLISLSNDCLMYSEIPAISIYILRFFPLVFSLPTMTNFSLRLWLSIITYCYACHPCKEMKTYALAGCCKRKDASMLTVLGSPDFKIQTHFD